MNRFVHNRWSHTGKGGENQPQTCRKQFGIGAKPTPEPHQTSIKGKCRVPGHIRKMTERGKEKGTQTLMAEIEKLKKELIASEQEKDLLRFQLEMANEQLQTALSTLKSKFSLIDALNSTPQEDLVTIAEWINKFKGAEEQTALWKRECVRLSGIIRGIAREIVKNNAFGKRTIAFQKIAKLLIKSEPLHAREGSRIYPTSQFLSGIGEFKDMPKIAKEIW